MHEKKRFLILIIIQFFFFQFLKPVAFGQNVNASYEANVTNADHQLEGKIEKMKDRDVSDVDVTNSFYYDGKTELNLKGEWQFYWKQLLMPGDPELRNPEVPFVKLPAYWKNHELSEEALPTFGYATYKTNIISSGDYKVGLEHSVPHSAEKIFLNGELIVETGMVSKNAEDEVGLWLPGTVVCKLRKGNNQLIWQLSNHVHARGGVFKVPVIGPEKHMTNLRESQLLINALIIGGLFFIGLFFIGMYTLWHRDLQFLYYGLYALLFGYWLSNYGLHIFKPLVGTLEFTLTVRLIYMTFYGGFFFFLLFIYETYKKVFSKGFMKISRVIYIFFILTAILTPPHIFTRLIAILQGFSFILLFYALYVIFRAILRKEKGSKLMFLGVFLFGLAKVSMFGSFTNVILRTDSLSSVLYFATYIVFSIALAQKLGLAFFDVFLLQQEAKIQRDEISRQADKLTRLDRFKSRFFANVSHDLRTPLTLIQGHIFRIKGEENYLNTKSQDSLLKLETNTGKLIQLTDEIRDLILLEDDKMHLKYGEIEINEYLKRLVNMFNSAAGMKKISLTFHSMVKSPVIIHLDPLQFEKIIYNLLANALKYTGTKGHINVGLNQIEDRVIITVKDDGAGISTEDAQHVFDRYYQVDQSVHYNKEGLGIGLALVLELVELHGGTIQVESKVGEGSKFSLSFPLNLDKELTENQENANYISVNRDLLLSEDVTLDTGSFVDIAENTKSADGVLTVLIVDDHPDIRGYIKELIDDQYLIKQASNGKEALQTLVKEKVDIVITDLMMPWMDGYGLIEEMKKQENLKDIPVLVVSARTSEEDKLKVLEQGVNDFLAKPFQPEELKFRIVNALRKSKSEPSIWDSVAQDKKKLNSIEKNILSKVNALILSRIDDPKLSVEHIAEELMASSRKAYTMINQMAGMNPKDYIRHIKFQYVMDLLKKKKVRSVTEAAQAIGMSNPTYFGKQFEKKMGVHPSDLI